MNLSETLSADFIDVQYRKWKSDPSSLSDDWQFFFKGFELAGTVGPADADPEQALRQAKVGALIHRYRDIGHLLACMDPLSACPMSHPLLDLDAFGLEVSDLDRAFSAPDLIEQTAAPLKEIVGRLKQTYCHSIGVEYMHLQDPDERAWLRVRMEPAQNQVDLTAGERVELFKKLTAASLFEGFLNKKYVGVTRFSLEGGEALIPFLDVLRRRAVEAGCREIIFGMAHRGRLNVLSNVLAKSVESIFSEFEDSPLIDSPFGSGDVKYHKGYSNDRVTRSGERIHLSLTANPSHLEAVDPVVEGRTRAKQTRAGDLERALADSRSAAKPVDLDEPIGRVSRMDAIQQQKMVQASRAGLVLRTRQVRAALERVAEGTYGACVSCEENIGFARLKALPETPLCMACQTRREKS